VLYKIERCCCLYIILALPPLFSQQQRQLYSNTILSLFLCVHYRSLKYSYSTYGGTTTTNGGNNTDDNNNISVLHHHRHHDGDERQPFSFDPSSCLEPLNLPPPPPPHNNNYKEDNTHLWVPIHDGHHHDHLSDNDNSLLSNNNVFTTMWPTGDDGEDDQMGAYLGLGGLFGTSTAITASIGLRDKSNNNNSNNNNNNMSTAAPKKKRGPKPKYLYKSAEEAAEARKQRNRKAALDSYYKKRNTIQELQDEITRLQRENDLLESVMAGDDSGDDVAMAMDVCEDCDGDGRVFVNEAELDAWIALKLKE